MPEAQMLRLARQYGLSLCLARLLRLLMTTDILTHDAIHLAIGVCNAKTFIHRLRAKLKITAPDIEIFSQRGVGYWLDKPTRARLALEHMGGIDGALEVAQAGISGIAVL